MTLSYWNFSHQIANSNMTTSSIKSTDKADVGHVACPWLGEIDVMVKYSFGFQV